MFKKRITPGLAAVSLLASVGLVGSLPASAIELEPNEVVPAPVGTNALLGYFYFNHTGEIGSVRGGASDYSAHANNYTELFRYVRYIDLGGTEGILEVLQPVTQTEGYTSHGSISTSNAGPTIFIAGFWPINDKANDRYLAFLMNLYVPTEGNNDRLQYDPQLGFHQGFDEHWSADFDADIYLYQDNSSGGTIYKQTISQDPSYQFQAFANYAWQPGFVSSIGWEAEFGGRGTISGFDGGSGQYLNDAPAGIATEFEKIRLTTSYFVTPQFQLLGEVQHDFVDVGAPHSEIQTVIRGLYVF